MKSRTKYELSAGEVAELFSKNGIEGASDIAPLGAGEYNAVFCATGPDGREYAVKIAPPPEANVMTHEKGLMASELFWYDQIRKHTSIRVPEVYVSDFSRKKLPADYFIMEKLPGTQLDKTEFSEAEKAESSAVLVKMAADIHKIKNDKFGYIQTGLHDTWYLAIRSMVENALADCKRAHRRSPRGKKLLRLIDRYKEILEGAKCCMVNFDLWPPNILCTRENGALHYAWLDPERSFWGDRLCDFVCLEPMLPLQAKAASLAAYNQAADAPVLATREERIRYAVALAYLALIMEVEKYFRYTPFHFGWWRNAGASSMFFKSAFATLEHI